MIRSKYEQFGNTSIWPYPCGVLDSFTVPLHSSNGFVKIIMSRFRFQTKKNKCKKKKK